MRAILIFITIVSCMACPNLKPIQISAWSSSFICTSFSSFICTSFSVQDLIITLVSFNTRTMHVVRFFRSAVMGECKHLGTCILRNQGTIWESHTWKRWNHVIGRNVSKAISVTVAYFPLATYDVNSTVSSIDLYWTQQKLNNVTFQWASVIFVLRFDNRKQIFCRVVNCW